jgi:hypothetical protein
MNIAFNVQVSGNNEYRRHPVLDTMFEPLVDGVTGKIYVPSERSSTTRAILRTLRTSEDQVSRLITRFEMLETELMRRVMEASGQTRPANTNRIMVFHSAGFLGFERLYHSGVFDFGPSVVKGIFLSDCLYNKDVNENMIELAGRPGAGINVYAVHINSASDSGMGPDTFDERFHATEHGWSERSQEGTSHSEIPIHYIQFAIDLLTSGATGGARGN